MNSATVCLGARRYWADGVKVETVRKCMSVSSWSGESVSEASWHSPFVRWGLSVCLCGAWRALRGPSGPALHDTRVGAGPRQIRVRFVVAIFSIYI